MEARSLQDFKDLCTFEGFKSFGHYYGYGVDQQELINREFKRIKGKGCLEFLRVAKTCMCWDLTSFQRMAIIL